MAAASGVSLRSVQRIWAAHRLQPHRVRRFKLSQDPVFAAKLRDVVGLYLDPPAHSLALPVDEKSQIQALDRAQPGLPIKKDRAGTMTHDYIRHGTTTLFDGVVGQDVGKASEALQSRKAEQQIGRAGNDGRRPKRLGAASRTGDS
jgi:hypothetical protein